MGNWGRSRATTWWPSRCRDVSVCPGSVHTRRHIHEQSREAKMKRRAFTGFCAMLICWWGAFLEGQESVPKPETPIEKWTGKTAMLIGAHADDDALCHGTLAMLQAHGNQVYIVTLTTGNVGTQDPNLSRRQQAELRRK